jgi:hypothetical protein
MQDPAEWGRASGGFSYESERKWIENFLSFERSHGGRSASYDSAGATGSAQGWPSLGMRDPDVQISRRSYGAGAASGLAWSGPMRSGHFHAERANRASAGQGAPYGKTGAPAGWKSRFFGPDPQQDRSHRAKGGGAGWRRHISSGGSQPNADMIAQNGLPGGSQPGWPSPDWTCSGFGGSQPGIARIGGPEWRRCISGGGSQPNADTMARMSSGGSQPNADVTSRGGWSCGGNGGSQPVAARSGDSGRWRHISGGGSQPNADMSAHMSSGGSQPNADVGVREGSPGVHPPGLPPSRERRGSDRRNPPAADIHFRCGSSGVNQPERPVLVRPPWSPHRHETASGHVPGGAQGELSMNRGGASAMADGRRVTFREPRPAEEFAHEHRGEPGRDLGRLQMRQRTTALGRLAAWLEQQKSGLKVGDNISEVLMMKYFDDVHEPACRKAATANSKSDGTRTAHGAWDALSFLEKNWGLAFNATVCKAAGGDGYNQSFFVGIFWQCVRSYARTVGRRRCLPQRGSAHMGAPTSSGSTGGARSRLRGRQGGELWGRRGRWPSEYTYLKYYTPCRQQAECLWKPDAVAQACAARLRKMPERYARLQLTVDTIKVFRRNLLAVREFIRENGGTQRVFAHERFSADGLSDDLGFDRLSTEQPER